MNIMKVGKGVLFGAAFIVASSGMASCQDEENLKSLKVLMIGNSFSICVGKQMPQIAESMGLKLELGSLYIGGCPLQKHWANWVAATNKNSRPYAFDVYKDGKKVCHRQVNIPEALSYAKWDIITFQQQSARSINLASFHPYAEKLQAAIRERLPNAEFVWQETWSYLPWDPHLKGWKIDQNEMYARLHKAYADIAAQNGQRVIPMGTAAQLWRRKLPVKYTADSFGWDVCGARQNLKKKDDGSLVYKGDTIHLNPIGHYLQGLVWTAKLYGVDVRTCEYAPKGFPPEKVALMKEVAMEAVSGEMPKARSVVSEDAYNATTNRVCQKDWAFLCGASRFGQVYLPDEVIVVKASLKSLRTDGAEPTMRLEKAVVTDWQDKEVLVKKCSGDITLTEDELKGRFGAFRVAFWGREQGAGNGEQDEKKLGETWFARLTGESKPVAWAGTGVHGWSTNTQRYALIAKAGLGTVRNDIPGWRGWEKEKGVYQCPRGFRETIDKMHSLGIEMNLILNSLNPLYGEKLDFDAFCNWIRYVVTHEGKDVDYYEVWNEPNNFYFGPKLRNTFFPSFTKFSKQVVKTIREVKPEANIEVVAEDGQWHTTVFLGLGIATAKEIVSIHPYIHSKNPRPEACDFYFRDDGRTIRSAMASNGVTRVRMTEIGWTTYAADEHGKTEHWYVGCYPGVHFDQQAYYMIRAYLMARTYGVESMMQYDFQNDGPKRNYTEHNFGMVFQDCTPKPSYAAVAFMTRLLGEAKPLGFVGERDAKVSTVCAFKLKDGRKAYAMWAYQDPVEAEIPVDVRGGFIFDLMGNRSKLGDRTKLTLTESPVYLVAEGAESE